MEKKLKRVKLYTGSMYAGKSKKAIEIMETCNKIGIKALCFKHTFDDGRFGKDKIVSRAGKETEAYSVKNYRDIEKIVKKQKNLNAVVIDELQFFGIDNEEEVEGFIKMLRSFANQGITSFLAGLDKTFEDKFFPITKRLIKDKLIEEKNIDYLKADCSVENCNNKAKLTARIIENKKLVDIGNGTKYKAVCKKHHNYHNEIDYSKTKWKDFKKKKKEGYFVKREKSRKNNYIDIDNIELTLDELDQNGGNMKTFVEREFERRNKTNCDKSNKL